MNRRKGLYLTIIAFMLCLNGYSQKLHTELAFDGLFDNREFKNDMQPQTIYGMRVIPEVGADQGRNRFMAGVAQVVEFGSDSILRPDIVMYYRYNGSKWRTYFGAMPRRYLQRQLPDAFLYDSIAYFEPTIQGTIIQYYGKFLQSELYCNWFSRQTEKQREAFRIVWDGYLGTGTIGAGWFTAMTHYAKPKEPGHYIYEKFQINPYLALNVSEGRGKDLITAGIQAGVLCSPTRWRKEDTWHCPTGFLGNIHAGWRVFDIKSTFYVGGSQQPLLDDPEAGLSFHRSDPFYNHTFYNRTELGVMFVTDRNVQLGFKWNLHFTPDTPVHNQQLITLNYWLPSKK